MGCLSCDFYVLVVHVLRLCPSFLAALVFELYVVSVMLAFLSRQYIVVSLQLFAEWYVDEVQPTLITGLDAYYGCVSLLFFYLFFFCFLFFYIYIYFFRVLGYEFQVLIRVRGY